MISSLNWPTTTRPGWVARRVVDWLGTPAAMSLGWTPSSPLDQTLDDLLEYWRGETP